MKSGPVFATTRAEFEEVAFAVSAHVDTLQRLPDWPFRAPTGFVTIYEFDRVVGGDFGRVLEALSAENSDDRVSVMAVAPEVSYYREGYGLFPAFSAEPESVAASYMAGMEHEPGGDPTGTLGISVKIVAMVGSSGRWSVWAERDWEIGLLLTDVPVGSWLSTDVPWFERDVDLDSIRSPAGWGMPLSETDLATFRRHVLTRGNGP